jgi:hypothetical protein
MSEKTISYLNSNYNEFREGIIDKTQKYYPDLFSSYNDASIGSWLIDVISDISDTLRYNIDRMYQETDVDSATTRESINQIARTNGLKISGPKCAIVEIELSCRIPMNNSNNGVGGNNLSKGDEKYCPIIKRGTLVSNGAQTFEIIEDVDFASQFDINGISNRQIIPNKDSNGNTVSYTYKKLTMARSGHSKIYKKIITNEDIVPFMNIIINDNNICNIESILMKEGTSLVNDPNISEFYIDKEQFNDKTGKQVERFFEVDNLIDQYRFGYVVNENTTEGYYNPVYETIDEFQLVDENGELVTDENGEVVTEVVRTAMLGQWKRLKNKFITEFTDENKLKITFGSGLRNQYGNIPKDAREFTKYMMSRMEANDYMGVLPKAGCTLYILYRVGGGLESNVGANTINTLTYTNMVIDGNCSDPNDGKKKMSVKNTLTVTNPTPSYGGKDIPSDEEVKYLIKYNNATQNRCVTLKDYYNKISEIHPKYGCPFRHSVVEVNNKVVIYTLGLDYQGRLNSVLSEAVANNMKEYLSMYKNINDFVEIRSGKVINLAFDINVYIDKSYDKSEVVKRIIELVQDYMDIRRHIMGEDIFLGDLEKEISKLDGVINLIALRCYNKVGSEAGYSDNEINQTTVDSNSECSIMKNDQLGGSYNENEIDLSESDKVLYSSIDSMFEIRYPNKDIQVFCKSR